MNPPERIACPQCRGPLELAGPLSGLCPRCLLAGEHRPTAFGEKGAPPPGPGELSPDLPQFDVVEVLGRGGMGIVYRARHRRLDREVALKVLAPEFSEREDFAERFVREARMLARLDHPNIVGVYDFGESGGVFYLVLELVDGTSLRDVIESDEKLRAAEALAIVPQVCEALAYAHGMGVVHRDIKPENILLDRQGRVKLADFGLAKLVGSDAERSILTRRSQIMGTPQYMAPEQLSASRDVDHRADIFSLGVVFYEMLTGQLPVGRFEPPSKRYAVDVRLDEVVLRALEHEPEKRYQEASQVRTDLDAISRGDASLPAHGRPRVEARPDRPAPAGETGRAFGLHGGGEPGVDYPAFLTRTSVPAWAILDVSVALGFVWMLVMSYQNLGRNQEWLAGAFPLAFLGVISRRTPCHTNHYPGWLRWAILGVGFAVCVGVVVLMAMGRSAPPGVYFLETVAAIFVVAGSVAFDRWGRRGDGGALVVCGVLLLIAGVMHTALHASPTPRVDEFLAYTSGYLSLMLLGSILPLAAEYLAPPAPERTPHQMQRVLGVGLPGVLVYFGWDLIF